MNLGNAIPVVVFFAIRRFKNRLLLKENEFWSHSKSFPQCLNKTSKHTLLSLVKLSASYMELITGAIGM